MCRSWYGSARFNTTSGASRSMRAVRAGTSSASIWAVVIFVFVVPSSFAFKASHFETVRLAMQISENASLFWQH